MTQKLFIKFDSVIRTFIDQIGRAAVEAKVEDVRQKAAATRSAFPVTYRQCFLPLNAFWIALDRVFQLWAEGKTLEAEINAKVDDFLFAPIAFALPMAVLFPTLPKINQDLLRSRVLGGDYLAPLFHEFDAAWDFVGHGYNLTWYDERGGDGAKVPEFRAEKGPVIFDVEAKAFDVNAGNPITLLAASRIAEAVLQEVSKDKNLTGRIGLQFPNRVPTQQSKIDELVNACASAIRERKSEFQFENTRIKIDVARDVRREFENIAAIRATLGAERYRFVAIGAHKESEKLINPIVVLFGSDASGNFQDCFKDHVRSACEKFSRGYPGVLRLYIPHFAESFGEGTFNEQLQSLMRWVDSSNERTSRLAALQLVSDYNFRHYPTNVEVFAPKRLVVNRRLSPMFAAELPL